MASVPDASKIGIEKYPRKESKNIQYGTAGFRTRAEDLDYVLYRVGMLAVLRSKSKRGKLHDTKPNLQQSHIAGLFMWSGSCCTSLKGISSAGALLTPTWSIAVTFTDFLVLESKASTLIRPNTSNVCISEHVCSSKSPLSERFPNPKLHLLNYALVVTLMISAAKCELYKQGAAIGLMITASHNPEPDNGVKLVDPLGEMLQQNWEEYATRLANASDTELESVLHDIAEAESINWETRALVVVGQDTRPSSPDLAQAAITGVRVLGGEVKDYGVVTTPMLHYFVACINTEGVYGEATENGYFKKMITAFKKLQGDKPDSGNYVPSIMLDGANGVGAAKMNVCSQHLGDSLRVQLYNDGTGTLNYLCGADYVKIQQCAPHGVPKSTNARCVSIDGDADRIVYYYIDANDKFHLLDGDRIATLIAGYLMELVQKSKLDLQLGLVQTAYANGSSTSYISKTLKIPVACVPTGVKHLHQKAVEYDIGVYFEANGHGTVVFSDFARRRICSAAEDSSLPVDQLHAVGTLAAVMDVINQTVGDAISDSLVVETVLHARGWSIQDWEKAYTDLPSRQLKVVVKDRRVVVTTDAERQCLAPPGLQDQINILVKNFPNGRSFVRPSGTEDIVRVYAEADTQSSADQLAVHVASAVHQLAGGPFSTAQRREIHTEWLTQNDPTLNQVVPRQEPDDGYGLLFSNFLLEVAKLYEP
ncbi:hypothetical protein Cfor_04283 [Coptotermes formosanus]|uniref:phosphoacetylglucosamine mutase n=1 Tax=Coptotermes formosanus TaxID=36987 RepID=A0A6L2Q0K7_COPFO|nr:hypothetical protein Cfor_04283 [Coptotermes formosanus]